ncbi:MAG: peptidylprolyl isomerase [Acidobacteria bacterium]|nr:peptidylprolyl isomerase [Acidobacteriota bacterium]
MRTLLLAAIAVIITGCGGSNPASGTKKREPLQVPDVYKVKLDTTKGAIVVEVTRAWAPRGADHFYELVHDKYFDGVKFHRVLRNFAAQFGIHPDLKRNQLWSSIALPDDPVVEKNRRGTLTFATRGPNTRATQLFFNLKDNSASLDGQGFSPIGKVVEGLDVMDQLAFVYGDGPPRGTGPDPKEIQTRGYSYLEREFPRLDTITTARILE